VKARRARAAALVLITLLAACGGREAPPASGAARGAPPPVLRRGNGPEPDSLDPQLARTDSAGNVLRDLYEGLTVLDRAGRPAPGIAERWEASADGRTWTFHLRDAAWSNGDPVTAADFVASWRRLVTPATGSQYAGLLAPVVGAADVLAGRADPATLGVAAPDARTFVVRLAHPAPYLPALAAHFSTLPVHGGRSPGRPGEAVSDGAYVLAGWTPGEAIRLVRNRRYWRDAATGIGEVRYVHVPDANDEYLRYRAGELDATYVLPPRPIADLKRVHGAEVVTGPQLGVLYYGLNVAKPPFAGRADLRRALSMAVDRERLVRQVTNLGEPPAYSWVPPGIADYAPVQPEWAAWPAERRLARARELYAAAGYTAARPLELELRFPTGGQNERVALAVAAMWHDALGVRTRLVPEEFKSLLQTVNRGEAQVFRASWVADYADPYSFLQLLDSRLGIDPPRYRSEHYEALLAAAQATPDPALRRERLAAAEQALLDDAPVVPLYFFVNKHLVAPRVQGWYDSPPNVVYSRELSFR
jgi:ABC-type oligopeptide transport system substrate-binding subunit